MVVTPALGGLFGLDWDALHHTLRLAPNLPVAWDTARLHNVPLGDARIDLDFARQDGRLMIKARSAAAEFCLAAQTAPRDRDCSGASAGTHELPLPGSRTAQLKVVGEQREANRYALELEAPGVSEHNLPVRFNRPGVRVSVSGAEMAGPNLRVRFPAGDGYRRVSVAFSW